VEPRVEIELAQRTAFLLSYVILKNDLNQVDPSTVDEWIEITNARLEADAVGWRDRPIHKLVTTPIASPADALRLYQGVGLVKPEHAGVMRGRLSITPDSADQWGLCAVERTGRAAILVALPRVRHEAMAIVTLEIERNR
jgi:hypothetical protein